MSLVKTPHVFSPNGFIRAVSLCFPRLRIGAVHLVATLFRFTHEVAGKVLRKRPTFSHSSGKIFLLTHAPSNFCISVGNLYLLELTPI